MPSPRTLIIAVVALAAAGAGAYYAVSHRSTAAVVDDSKSWPAPFNTLPVDATQDQVTAKVGKPQSTSANPYFELKSPTEWASIEKQVADMSAKDNDPYAAVTPADRSKLVNLSRSLEHQVKTVWMYPASGGIKGKIALSFDGDGKLMRLDIQHPRPPGQVAAASPTHH